MQKKFGWLIFLLAAGWSGTVRAAAKEHPSGYDSIPFSVYDLYQFEDDSLLQSVYVHYITPRKIQFFVRTKNKISAHLCEYTDTARMASGEGTAQGSDEMNKDELYGVYEYFTRGKPFFTLDIEFKRGKRMTIFTKGDKALCANDCPLSSKGTMRKKQKVDH